nr:MAG TPA: hypothetical protein [Caudoviricetes sp.]
MPAGLQVFDEAGRLKLDLTRRITKVLGTRIVSGSGEIDLSGYVGMSPWYFLPEALRTSPEDVGETDPTLWIDQKKQKICWKEIPSRGIRIHYGVY